MSAVEEQNTRKRPIRKTAPKNETTSTETEKVVREVIPLPAEKIGTTLEGVIVNISLQGRISYGFLSATGFENYSNIYFRPASIGTGSDRILLRKGYQVTFKLALDEHQRQVASDIALTEEGNLTRLEKEAAIIAYNEEKKKDKIAHDEEAKKADAPRKRSTRKPKSESTAEVAAPAAEPDAEKKSPRAPRKPKAQRLMTITFATEDGSNKATAEVDLNAPFHVMRFAAAKALGITTDGSLYINGEILTAALRKALTEKDVISFGPRREKPVETA